MTLPEGLEAILGCRPIISASDQAWLAGIPEEQAARLARLPEPVYEVVVSQSIENGLDRDGLDRELDRVEAIVREATFEPLEESDEPEVTASRKSSRERGYVAWNPRKKTRVRLGQVLSIFEKYKAQRPLTGRQVVYRAMVHFDYSKKEAESFVYYILDRGRRAKIIPFEWVRDDNIVTYSSPWYAGPEEFWDETGRRIKDYRRDRQAGQRQQTELWCEAAGMGPQLDRPAWDYAVPVFSNGGTNSISAQRQVVDHALGRNVPTVLLHVGDFDPYGEAIFNAFVENAQAFLEEDRIVGTQRIIPVRVALTDEQVKMFKLPTQPTKKPESKAHATIRERWITKYGDRTCQAEALAPDVLAKIVREAIEEHLDLDLWREQVEQEEPDRTAMLRALPAGGEV